MVEFVSYCMSWHMRRFYFDLQGEQNIDDESGLLFKTDLEAFKSAQRFALHLANSRPQLHGTTCVVVRRAILDDGYYVSV